MARPSPGRGRGGGPATSGRAAGGAGAEPGGAEAFLECGVKQREVGGLGVGHGGEEPVGEGRVAGEYGAVEVGADDVAVDRAFGAGGVAVAAAGDDPAEGGEPGAEGGSAPVVLEPGEAGQRRVGSTTTSPMRRVGPERFSRSRSPMPSRTVPSAAT